eukprot:7369013-Pyramimonas_sp.AAC.1
MRERASTATPPGPCLAAGPLDGWRPEPRVPAVQHGLLQGGQPVVAPGAVLLDREDRGLRAIADALDARRQGPPR